MHPVQSGKGKMYRLHSDDRIIPLNPVLIQPYILIVTHKEIGENRGKGGTHSYTIHLIIEVTLEQEVRFLGREKNSNSLLSSFLQSFNPGLPSDDIFDGKVNTII